MKRLALWPLACFAVACGADAVNDLELTAPQSTQAAAEALRVWGKTEVPLGGTVLLGATLVNDGDTLPAADAAWATRDAAIASVIGRAAYADVVGEALGQVWLVATVGDLADSVQISVVQVVPGNTDTTSTGSGPVATIDLAPATQTVAVGDSAGVHAIPRNADGAEIPTAGVTWSVSEESVAEIELGSDRHLILRARAPGTVTVTASAEGKSATATVVVQ